MPPYRRPHRTLAVLLACLAAVSLGCNAVPTVTKKPKPATTAPSVLTSGDETGKPIPLETAHRTIDQVAGMTSKVKLVPVTLTGKVKMLSDQGGGIISNHGGNLISDAGGNLIGKIRSATGIIANNGGGIIANNGGGVTSKVKYGLLQAGVENLLADADVEVLDAAGAVLVDAADQPIKGTTDTAGTFKLTAQLPDENLVLRIRLWNGGQLLAFLVRGPGGERTIDLTTSTSLGAAYVLDRYVQQRPAVLARLPGTESDALVRDMEAARGGLAGTPRYTPAELAAAVEGLRKKTPALDATLGRIQAIMLAGLADFGNGQAATRVSLAIPGEVGGDAAGNLYIAERGSFRIRKVTPDGRIVVHAGYGGGKGADLQGQTLEDISGLIVTPAGTVYATQRSTGQVRVIEPSGETKSYFVLNDLHKPGPLALAADGTLFVAETEHSETAAARIVARAPDGTITPVDLTGIPAWSAFSGLGRATDGTLYAMTTAKGGVFRKLPGQPWTQFLAAVPSEKGGRLHVATDGTVYVTDVRGHQVLRLASDGSTTVVAGSGRGGAEGDGGPATAATLGLPKGMWAAPDGNLYIADEGGQVRVVKPDGVITTVAGTSGVIEGDASTIAVNYPGGVALDPQGRLLIVETGGSTIKRLDGGALSLFAGSADGPGNSGDGGPALGAQFESPTGIAVGPDGVTWVLDLGNVALRKIDAAGTVTTAVRSREKTGAAPALKYPATGAPIGRTLAIAVSPAGLPYWSDLALHAVFRLTAAGEVEVVAGIPDLIGTPNLDVPANASNLTAPFGVAFDAKGDFYFAATGNGRILRLPQGDPTRKLETFAGLDLERFAARAALGAPGFVLADDEGRPALDTMLYGPSALVFDKDGNLFISELGTAKLASLTGSSGVDFSQLEFLPHVGSRIRRLDLDGRMHTVAGEGGAVLNDLATDDSLLYPVAMAFDRENRLVIADSALAQIKLVPRAAL